MNKIVWAEGVFLSQQHFQAWDKQLERSQNQRQFLINPFSWGIISLSIDQDILERGRFQVLEVSVLFQDGRLVRHQSTVDAPLICDLDAHGGDALGVYLALPANDHVGSISGYPQQSQASGWVADYREIEDCFDASRKREILLARPNLHLLTDEEALGPFLSIKIAEVVHDGDQRYRLIDTYIPPVCRLSASPVLVQRLSRIVETLNAKRKQIESAREGCDGGASGFACSDPNNHALLQSLNGILPQLKHLAGNPDLHPEQLYRQLCQVAGSFCTYHNKATIDSIPPYQHEDLGQVFQKIDSLLSLLLELKTTAKATALVLEKESDCLLSCTDVSGSLFNRETFFIEALFDAEDPNWITDFARQVKVTARSVIETSVASALPGVRLVHTQRPPAKLATRSGCEYFRLEPRGDFWNQMIEEGSLAVYLPHPFNTANIKIVTVEE
jgi:type VI secretion system protein ImpJ